MAAANRSIRHIFYAPNMCHLAKRLCIQNRSMATITSTNSLSRTSPVGIWHQDPSFPLPGNINVDMNAVEGGTATNPRSLPQYQSLASALLEVEDEAMRKRRILNQFVNENIAENDSVSEKVTTLTDSVECKIQTCPESLVKGFRDLFSDQKNDVDEHLTVITISQKTENDMTSWSAEVEEEREELTRVFIDNAKEICLKIKGNGYWADFIEPVSGHAYFGEHRNETLFETDDRLNQLGFEIEDLGCCKVLLHKDWKSHVFVGLIFTNAPVESHFFENM